MTAFLYSGSWNPLHEQHLYNAHYVEQKFGCEVVFELCQTPYDKEPLSWEDIDSREQQFRMIGRKIITSNYPSFVQKSYRGFLDYIDFGPTFNRGDEVVFIVGYDTIKRIDDKKYYFNSEEQRLRCLNIIKANTCKFMVMPRDSKTKDGLSEQILEMCYFPDSDYIPKNISSSDLRNQNSVDIMGYRINKKWVAENVKDIVFRAAKDIINPASFKYDADNRVYVNKYTDEKIVDYKFELKYNK